MKQAFWRGKRVFLTGHTGFKGAWLSLWLERLGANVTGLALDPPTRPSLFDICNVHEIMSDRRADIRGLGTLATCLGEAQPEILIHLAAQSLVRPSYVTPVETFEVNTLGTINVLEAARHCASLRAVIIVTSDKCYRYQRSGTGYMESDPLGGHDPYSSSKACAEIVTESYRKSYFAQGPAVASVRAGNVIGGGDWALDRLIPDAVRAFEANTPLEIRNPAAIRPWQHVLEPLGGYLLLAEALYTHGQQFAEAWNFGPGDDDCCSVAEVVESFASVWGAGCRWLTTEAKHIHEADYLKLNSDKARQQLAWRPTLRLPEALGWTAQWYQAWRSGQDMRDFTLAQIGKFEDER